MFESIDPTTGTVYRQVALDPLDEVERKLRAADTAYRDWRRRSFSERAGFVSRLAASIRDDRDRLATLMTREMGKPIRESWGEVDKCAWCFEHYAANAEHYLASQEIASDAATSYVQHLPLGPVFGILPWNAPLWLASRCSAPALMAGNVVLIKHDSHVPGCAEALAEHASDILPPGVLQMMFVDTDGAETVMRDPRVRAVSFTGSARAGRIIGGIAGSEIKPVVLELGGSDPAVVLKGADLDTACDTIATSRMINAGQSCIAAKRILVEREVYEPFVDRMEKRLAALKVGNPSDEATDIGPLAREGLRDEVHRQVRQTVEAGARCLLGGRIPQGQGWFYPPTLLVDVPVDSPAFREETFGPVMAVTPVADTEEAIDLANDTPFGLAAAVWCDPADGEALAARIEAGQIAVNGIVKTDPRLPSGGIKNSGLGRELGQRGILEFVNAQQVWVGPPRS